MENGIDADAFQFLAVFIEATRISIIVFVRAELVGLTKTEAMTTSHLALAARIRSDDLRGAHP